MLWLSLLQMIEGRVIELYGVTRGLAFDGTGQGAARSQAPCSVPACCSGFFTSDERLKVSLADLVGLLRVRYLAADVLH